MRERSSVDRTDYEHADSEQLRERIRRTRASMDETVDELASRLNPRSLLEEVKDAFDLRGETGAQLRERCGRMGRQVVDQVREHPVPAAMIGIGLAWMLFGDRSGVARRHHAARPDGGYVEDETDVQARGASSRVKGAARSAMHGARHTLGRAAHGVGEGMSRAADSAREKLGRAAHNVGSSARGAMSSAAHGAREAMGSAAHGVRVAGERVRENVHHARERANEAFDDAPLAFGAGAAAIGLVCGLLLPRSRFEDNMVGDAADDLRERVVDVAEDAKERAMQTASSAVGAAADAATRTVSEEGRKHVRELEDRHT